MTTEVILLVEDNADDAFLTSHAFGKNVVGDIKKALGATGGVEIAAK